MELQKNERILILGGSRGFGAALARELRNLSCEVLSISRKSDIKADFSKCDLWPHVMAQIRELKPHRILYCAAGGPYGLYSQFQWKDHQWSWRVTFEFPAFLLHSILVKPLDDLRQVVFVGSSIAESKPDPGAASYCAAKHALRGVITSVQAEQTQAPLDIRLWSPGYMQTDLLPLKSSPRQTGQARKPHDVAKLMIRSISDPALRSKNQSID